MKICLLLNRKERNSYDDPGPCQRKEVTRYPSVETMKMTTIRENNDECIPSLVRDTTMKETAEVRNIAKQSIDFHK